MAPGRPRDKATLVALAVSAIALVALLLASWLLLESQRDQRDNLRRSYGQRAEIATDAVAGIFGVAFAGQAREAATRFGQVRPPAGRLDAIAREGGNVYAVIVDPSGELLAASSDAPDDLRRRLARVPAHLRSALRDGYGLSDVRVESGRALVEAAVAFQTPFGRRVQVTAVPVETYVRFLSSTLAGLPRIVDGSAWVFDSRARILARAGFARRLRAPDRDLVRRIMGGRRSGTFDGVRGRIFYQTDPLPSSSWQVVLTAPEQNLFEPVQGASRWLSWALLVLGFAALVAIALLLRRLVRTAVALRGSNAELQRSNADLEQFAYVASHDLSEPLRTVAGFSQLLGKRYAGRLDAEADVYIEHMVAGVDRMQQLIDDLLLYSRVGREPVRADPVDLDELLGEVLAGIDPAVRERGARISSDRLPLVAGERSQLAQVLQNLLVNAIKFTAPGVTPQVHVSAERRDGMWAVSVRDNGIGIDADKDVIFTMFARLHPADAYPGTGIGLALVKRILERHGGDIDVEPAPGGGSVFTFTLPARAPVPAPPRVQAPA